MHHQHILPQTTILRVVNASWNSLWDTRVGKRPLRSLRIDAQVIGKLFQELMTHQLHAVDPVMWPDPLAPRSAKDPDFNCIDARYSFELKMCSQKGSRHVYGNRCSSPGYMSTKGKSRGLLDDDDQLYRYANQSNPLWVYTRNRLGRTGKRLGKLCQAEGACLRRKTSSCERTLPTRS